MPFSWVKFLDGVGDEDGDGFPEIYGQINPKMADPKIAARLRGDYSQKVFSAEEIETWWRELGAQWYPEYNTIRAEWVAKSSGFLFEDDLAEEGAEVDIIKDFPSSQTEPEVVEVLKSIDLNPATLILRGRPHGKNIYNILLIGSP